eukprot:CAMPEP_0113315822 /NCGR_PEP_ID=MMETSP0010_2-20120614/11339_1 /TAXON_ID=216773 ORGANISM="Corethron hystrix, Strain 308" /NCGR_SAMPLE_ID=MMETSP0010_2 /ASSEMBLY_ACC=CAM_ASM_000155 /LENGTH=129 /DNA_ID=CAMNT_0000172405 /DNA_START=34 /DNA_END=423 /DNA_ORIENTATION=+ /assembly_acc=CAM_ASM_000155
MSGVSKGNSGSANKKKTKKFGNQCGRNGGNLVKVGVGANHQKNVHQKPRAGDGEYDDDLEFLDQEISKIKSSHGRKIDAKGKGYCNMISDIYNRPPSPRERQRDGRALGQLRNKVLEKKGDRKTSKSKG